MELDWKFLYNNQFINFPYTNWLFLRNRSLNQTHDVHYSFWCIESFMALSLLHLIKTQRKR